MIDRILRRGPRIDEAIARLRKYSYAPATLEKLTIYLAGRPAADLEHINIPALREALDLDEEGGLELLVAGVHEGLFDLYWAAHCAHCGGLSHEWDHLAAAKPETYCQGCKVNSPTLVDRNMHVRFALNEQYRATRASGGPRRPGPYPASDDQLTGIELLNVQAFRDLLIDEVLPPTESLAVTRIAFLFSDLRGSTALYARKGDPVAYRLVREHYDLILRNVKAHRGAIVKTVGDGVMASFTNAVDGLRAALDIQRNLIRFNQDHALTDDDALRLKLGLHAGACLSVNLSGRMDYFGTAVNIAARVEGLSHGDDVVTTAAVLREEDARRVLAEARARGAETTEFTSPLRGIEEPVLVTRIMLPRSALATAPLGVPAPA